MKIVKEPMYINEDCGRIIKETSLILLSFKLSNNGAFEGNDFGIYICLKMF